MVDASPQICELTDPSSVTSMLRQQLIECWVAVTNAGGAVGFPFPPISVDDVAPVADELIKRLHPDRSRLLLALEHDKIAGWVNLHRDPKPLIAHWGIVSHLQTHPTARGQGVATVLMRHVHRTARDGMKLEQLHLAVRGGAGLEDFYSRLGWEEVGRWPSALRLGPSDDRDEVLMFRALR